MDESSPRRVFDSSSGEFGPLAGFVLVYRTNPTGNSASLPGCVGYRVTGIVSKRFKEISLIPAELSQLLCHQPK